MNKFIEISIPYLFGKEKEYLNECIETNFVSSVGPLIKLFENKISNSIGLEDGCSTATCSGTSSIHLGLIVAGVEKGDIVITSDYTFIASANAISHSGAIPWLIDIEKESLTINTKILEKELREETKVINGKCIHIKSGKKVSAIVPVFTLGHPPDLDSLTIISEEFKIPIVSDAAAGIGANYRSSNIGNKSLITCFSFNGNKSITCGGGGALCSPNKKLVEKAKHIGSTARVGNDYDHDMVGYNYRMTNVQAAIGLGQIENLEFIIKRKRTISEIYGNSFKNHKDFYPIPECGWARSAKWLSGIIIKDNSTLNSEKIIKELNNKYIRARKFWKPIHLQKPYKNAIYKNINISKKIWEKVIILPSSVNLKNTEIDYVINSINEII